MMATPSDFAVNYTPDTAKRGAFWSDLDLWKRHEGFRNFVERSPAAKIAAGAAIATRHGK